MNKKTSLVTFLVSSALIAGVYCFGKKAGKW